MEQSRPADLAHQAPRRNQVAERLRRGHRGGFALHLELPHPVEKLPGCDGVVPDRHDEAGRQIRPGGEDQAAVRRLPRHHHGLWRIDGVREGPQGDGQRRLQRHADRQRLVHDRIEARLGDRAGAQSRLLAAQPAEARSRGVSRRAGLPDPASGLGERRVRLRHPPRSATYRRHEEEHRSDGQLHARLGMGLPVLRPDQAPECAVPAQGAAPGDLLGDRPPGDRG